MSNETPTTTWKVDAKSYSELCLALASSTRCGGVSDLEGTASAGTLGFEVAAVGVWGTPTTEGFTGSLLRYRAVRGFGGSSM